MKGWGKEVEYGRKGGTDGIFSIKFSFMYLEVE